MLGFLSAKVLSPLFISGGFGLLIARAYATLHVLYCAMVETGKGSIQRINTLLESGKVINRFYNAVVGQEKAGEESLVKDF